MVFHDNFRPEVVNDIISSVTIEYVDVDVRAKFGDSRSNRSRDIRVAHFLMDDDERTTVTLAKNAQPRFYFTPSWHPLVDPRKRNSGYLLLLPGWLIWPKFVIPGEGDFVGQDVEIYFSIGFDCVR